MSSQFQRDKMYFIMSSCIYVYIFPFKLFDSKWNLYCWNYEKWIQLYFSYMTIQLFECHLLINSHVFHWHKISVLKKKKNNIPMYLGCPTFSIQFHWYVNSGVLFHITLALYYFFKYLYFITVKNCITIFRVWWLNDSFIIPVYIFYKDLGRISTCFVRLPI